MTDSREVCQICYRSTSHKASPTLTPESKSTYDAGTKKNKCNVCRQGWAPIRITRDAATGKWTEIRTRPKIPLNIDYQFCKSCQSRTECPKGLECSFAHSKIELDVWNAERQSEPRPAPPVTGPYQYQLCKHILNTGTCPFGQRCTFAHSEEEKRQWLRTQTGMDMNSRLMGGAGYMMNSMDYKCDACGLTCTSAKQLEDHLAGSRHRQMVNKPSEHYQYPPRAAGGHVRQRPTLSFPINGYKLCRHTQGGTRCVFGDFCTFAHSQFELDEWNKQLQVASHTRTTHHINRFSAMAGTVPPESMPHPQTADISQANTASGLDDFDEVGFTPGDQDFGAMIRGKILRDHNKKESLAEFEGTCEGVTIVEVTRRGLCLLWSQASSIDWVFEITTTSPCTLHSVTLFDSFLTDFDLTGAIILNQMGSQKLSGLGKSEKGVGLLLNQKFNPRDKIRIKVTLIPRSGLLGQLVVFDFGSFTMIRGLAVHVLTEQESKMLDTAALKKGKTKTKPDLFWEHHHRIIPMDLYSEETDQELPPYQLPEQIEKFIERGTYRNVELHVTRENYCKRMHNLLYLEEYSQREDMSRYDLYDMEVQPQKNYSTALGHMFMPTPGHAFLKLQLGEALFEGGRSVRKGDSALLLPCDKKVVHECDVEYVAKEWVILKITDQAKADCASAGGRGSIRFQLGRVHMRSMHYAVDHLDLSTIFPATNAVTSPSFSVGRCLDELKKSELNKSQQEAITSMLDPACTAIPSLVLGPFGCGKTRTLSECIKLLALLVPEARILICTHSNSAANLYVESFHNEWNKRLRSKAPLLRQYYTGRKQETIPPIVKEYCKFNKKGELVLPSVAEYQSSKIVVATLVSSRAIVLSQVPRGHFTHIFIDEAAQALESESIIPLCLAGGQTKVVLAGDHMQMDPPVYSLIARKYGLHVSLLERLYDHEAYDSGVGMLCKTLLTENHRSHQQILELPSKLFYKSKLTCKAVLPSTGPQDFPPIKFVGVSGKEAQDEDSPSYYNEHEVLKIAEQVQLLVNGGLEPSEICVLAYYHSQVQRIRLALRRLRKGLSNVGVVRVEDAQGKEFRALLLSTVRTCSTEPPEEEEAGFLTNPKMFNTAVTRAKQWLVVVGEPFTLCTVGENRLCWMEYIRCCQAIGSFDYTNADQFVDECLDYKIVVRQLLEKVHSSFFNPNKPLTLTPAAYSKAGAEKRLEMLRARVKQVTVGGDESTIKKITEELVKLSMEEQITLITTPEQFTAKVKEIESVFRRAGPTAAILSSNRMEAPLLSHPTASVGQGVPRPPPPQGSGFNGGTPVTVGPNVSSAMPMPNGGAMAVLAGDLPPYLRTSMESVAIYARWVEHILRSPLVASPEIRENMLRQQVNVTQQLRLVNEQIFLYREVGKLIQLQMRTPQPQAAHPGAQAMAPPPVTMGTNPAHAPSSTQPPPHPQPAQSQPYQLFSQPTSNPSQQTVPRPQGAGMQGNPSQQTVPRPQGAGMQGNPSQQTVPRPQGAGMPGNPSQQTVPRPQGAGMQGNPGSSAFSYGAPLQSQASQPNFVAGVVKGGRSMNPAGSTPSAGPHRNEQEVYMSDEELFQ